MRDGLEDTRTLLAGDEELSVSKVYGKARYSQLGLSACHVCDVSSLGSPF